MWKFWFLIDFSILNVDTNFEFVKSLTKFVYISNPLELEISVLISKLQIISTKLEYKFTSVIRIFNIRLKPRI